MFSYAIRRFFGAIPTLLIIITLAFFMMRLAPGGPFDSERVLPPEIAKNIAAAYDLDKPVYQQYFIYVGRLLHGDFGPSYKIRDFTVTQLIAQGFPVSFKIGLLAFGGSTGILPELERQVVQEQHWLTRQEFVDSFALGQLTRSGARCEHGAPPDVTGAVLSSTRKVVPSFSIVRSFASPAAAV